jgi:hypothetical protein
MYYTRCVKNKEMVKLGKNDVVQCDTIEQVKKLYKYLDSIGIIVDNSVSPTPGFWGLSASDSSLVFRGTKPLKFDNIYSSNEYMGVMK